MKKIYYEKIGRKYVPVAEYDSDWVDSFHKGTHLLMVYPGGQSRRFNVDPDYAGLIAASRVAEDAMCKALNKASELRPARTPITPAQQRAWKKTGQRIWGRTMYFEWSKYTRYCRSGHKGFTKGSNGVIL